MGPDTDSFKVFTAMGMTDQNSSVEALLDSARDDTFTRHSDYKLSNNGDVVSKVSAAGSTSDETSKFTAFHDGIHFGHFSIQYGAEVFDQQNNAVLQADVDMTKPFIGSENSFHITVSDGQGNPFRIVDGSCSSEDGSCDEKVKDSSGHLLVKVHSTSDIVAHPQNFSVQSQYRDPSDHLIGTSRQTVSLDLQTHELVVDTATSRAK